MRKKLLTSALVRERKLKCRRAAERLRIEGYVVSLPALSVATGLGYDIVRTAVREGQPKLARELRLRRHPHGKPVLTPAE